MDNPSTHQMLQTALQLQKSGKFQEAHKTFEQVLAREPRHPHALNGLGTIALQHNRIAEAVDYFNQAVAASPSELGFNVNLATGLLRMGRLQEAWQAYQRVIAMKPDFAEAYTNIGVVLAELGRLDEAVSAHRKCIELKPQYVGAYLNLGSVFQTQGKFAESVGVFKQALTLDPNRVDAMGKLAGSYISMGLTDRLRYHDAAEVLQRGLALQPSHPYLLAHLGVTAALLGRPSDAVTLNRRALEIFPGFHLALLNLAASLHKLGEFDEALACYRKGVAAEPSEPASWHYNMAFTLMVQGNWLEGFAEYEWRLRYFNQYKRNWSRPRWDGFDLSGKSLLLFSDQGIGDAFHFIRYASILAECGAKIVVECQRDALTVVKRAPGVSDAVVQGDPLPSHDYYIPLASLPYAMRTTPETVPATIPYLSALPERIESWKERLAEYGPDLKVGLVWAGSPVNGNDIHRSMLLADLAPLADVKGVQFFSLQKGPQASQLLNPPPGLNIVDFGGEHAGFEEMAGLIANLDVLITVDTAAAHLAGAMGKLVWNLIQFVPDWRWLLTRLDTPWYPTMRLFRQLALDDWTHPVARLRKELVTLAQKHGER